MSTIAKDDFREWERKRTTTLVSTIVIIAGVAVLVQKPAQAPAQKPIRVYTQQAPSTVQMQAVLDTAAGAASILDRDFMQETFLTTAGAAAVLDSEVMVELPAEAVQAADVEESEYANLAIANVDNYVNVRSAPNTDSEIVGKMYLPVNPINFF